MGHVTLTGNIQEHILYVPHWHSSMQQSPVTLPCLLLNHSAEAFIQRHILCIQPHVIGEQDRVSLKHLLKATGYKATGRLWTLGIERNAFWLGVDR